MYVLRIQKPILTISTFANTDTNADSNVADTDTTTNTHYHHVDTDTNRNKNYHHVDTDTN
jgi:hypothetical protein